MDPPAGSFYGHSGGYSLTPTYSLNGPAMTPPTTPSASGQRSQTININQKLDLMLSMFMEQKKTVEDTKSVTDELQKQVVSLSSDMGEVKNKMENMSTIASTSGNRKKNPSSTLCFN